MPTTHRTSQILQAVLEKMATGHGFTRKGPVAHFDSTILVNQTRYHVVLDWPDGAGMDALAPLIEAKTYTVLTNHKGGGWEPRGADLTLAEAQRLAKECHAIYKDEVLIAPTSQDHRSLVALGDCR
jgi:hypothetical protein